LIIGQKVPVGKQKLKLHKEMVPGRKKTGNIKGQSQITLFIAHDCIFADKGSQLR
jgi:hypothetical protein